MTDHRDPEWLVNQIAHVLRNPLFAATVQLEAIAVRAAADPDLERPTTVLRDQLMRLETLIDDMLLYGREPRLSLRRLDPRTLLDAVAEDAADAGGGRRAAISVTGTPSGAEARWDPELVRTILGRILDNAIQHSDPPHEITVALRRSGDLFELAVADRGHGMPPEVVEHATRPFFPQHRGRPGLGLAIAHKLVAALGGELAIRSAPDVGTTVTVTLPADVDTGP